MTRILTTVLIATLNISVNLYAKSNTDESAESHFSSLELASEIISHGKEVWDEVQSTGLSKSTLLEIGTHLLVEADQQSIQIIPDVAVLIFHMWGAYDQGKATIERLRTGNHMLFILASSYAGFCHAYELYETATKKPSQP